MVHLCVPLLHIHLVSISLLFCSLSSFEHLTVKEVTHLLVLPLDIDLFLEVLLSSSLVLLDTFCDVLPLLFELQFFVFGENLVTHPVHDLLYTALSFSYLIGTFLLFCLLVFDDLFNSISILCLLVQIVFVLPFLLLFVFSDHLESMRPLIGLFLGLHIIFLFNVFLQLGHYFFLNSVLLRFLLLSAFRSILNHNFSHFLLFEYFLFHINHFLPLLVLFLSGLIENLLIYCLSFLNFLLC